MPYYTQNHIDLIDSLQCGRAGVVDMSIMALSEGLNITQVCTFDRDDLSLFRPTHCEYLELLL